MPYSGNPSASAVDQVRFILGDTDVNSPLLNDAEVAYLLAQSGGNVTRAAIAGCYAILGKLAPAYDESVGSVSVSFSQQRANYTQLLSNLQAQNATSGAVRYRAYAGGVSWADKWAVASNPDRVQPQFRRRQYVSGARALGVPRGVPAPYDDGCL